MIIRFKYIKKKLWGKIPYLHKFYQKYNGLLHNFTSILKNHKNEK